MRILTAGVAWRIPVHALMAAAVLVALAPATPPAYADDVHLTNGNTFEGVIARVDGDEVRIRLPHGEIALPMSRVLRIDKADSALSTYLARERELIAADAGAADWLALARWALDHNLEHGARESALRAARLDPRLEGLEGVLGELDYVYEPELDRWITYDESMERRGYILYQGGWVLRSDLEERQRQLEQEETRRRSDRAEATARLALEQAIEARVQAEVAREVARTAAPYPVQYPGVYPGLVTGVPAVVGTFFVPVFDHGRPGFPPRSSQPAARPPASPSPSAPRSTPPRQTESSFLPPAGQLLEQRDLGGHLAIDLPNGYGGAPGRLHHPP